MHGTASFRRRPLSPAGHAARRLADAWLAGPVRGVAGLRDRLAAAGIDDDASWRAGEASLGFDDRRDTALSRFASRFADGSAGDVAAAVAACPAWLLATPLDVLRLDGYATAFAEAAGASTVGDLASLPATACATHVGAGTTASIVDAVRRELALGPPEVDFPGPGSVLYADHGRSRFEDCVAAWLRGVASRNPREARTLAMVAGFRGPASAYADVARRSGASAARVEQVLREAVERRDAHGWRRFLDEVVGRFYDFGEPFPVDVRDLAGDPWIGVASDLLGTLVPVATGGRIRLVDVGGRRFLAPLPQNGRNAARAATPERPHPSFDVVDGVDTHREACDEPSPGDGGEPFIATFLVAGRFRPTPAVVETGPASEGMSRLDARLFAVVAASPAPMTYAEIVAALAREEAPRMWQYDLRRAIPRLLVALDGERYGTPSHIRLTAAQRDDLAEAFVALAADIATVGRRMAHWRPVDVKAVVAARGWASFSDRHYEIAAALRRHPCMEPAGDLSFRIRSATRVATPAARVPAGVVHTVP